MQTYSRCGRLVSAEQRLFLSNANWPELNGDVHAFSEPATPPCRHTSTSALEASASLIALRSAAGVPALPNQYPFIVGPPQSLWDSRPDPAVAIGRCLVLWWYRSAQCGGCAANGTPRGSCWQMKDGLHFNMQMTQSTASVDVKLDLRQSMPTAIQHIASDFSVREVTAPR
jgi:hypothetical protein